jgi:micrococcal nuclease
MIKKMGDLVWCGILMVMLTACAASPVTTPDTSSLNSSSHLPKRVLKSSKISPSCEDSDSAFNCVVVVDVYDGDTIFIDIPGNHPLFGKRMGVRILGIDTPEMHSKNICEKKRAQAVLRRLIEIGERVDVTEVKKDKYFRILGNVLVDGKSVADELVRQKLAFPYHGEKKPVRDWCR